MTVPPLNSAPVSAPSQFNPAAVRNGTPAAQRAAVAAQFEAILVRQMLDKTMSSMLGSNGGAGGVAGSVYGDMLSDTISQQLTAGSGLGLSRFIQQQLTPKGETADPATTTSAPSTRPMAAPHS